VGSVLEKWLIAFGLGVLKGPGFWVPSSGPAVRCVCRIINIRGTQKKKIGSPPSKEKGNIFSTDRLLLSYLYYYYCCFRLLSFASSCFLSRKLLLTTEAAARHKLGVEFAAWLMLSPSTFYPLSPHHTFLLFLLAFLYAADHLLWLLLWLI